MPKFRAVEHSECILIKPSVELSKEVQEVISWVEKLEKGTEHEVSLETPFKGLGRIVKKNASVRGKVKIKRLDEDGKTWRILVVKNKRTATNKIEAKA